MHILLNAFVHTLRFEAQDIISIELRPVDDGKFPPFEAGSHVDVHLPNGMVRSYSLLNSPQEQDRYVIGVLKDRASRGGSRYVHEQLRIGMKLEISEPRNNFQLHEDAAHSVLVAGGIGITPVLCMARRLKAKGQPFEMLYLARSRSSAAFMTEIAELGVPIHWHFDNEAGGPPDLRSLLASRGDAKNTHYYACGPAVMLDVFEKVCAELGYLQAHIERFNAVEVAPAIDARGTYLVQLKRSAREITVTPGTSLLAALKAAHCDVTTSCEEGICGTCETKVLGGEPDHRDSILSKAERTVNKSMMVCVSGCKSATLILDL